MLKFIIALLLPTAAFAGENQIRCESFAKKLKSSKQLIVVLANDWQTKSAKITRYERDSKNRWRQVGQAADALLGKNGLGWGRGLQTVSGEESVEFRRTHYRWEGDNKSPAGVFTLGESFGTSDEMKNLEKNKKETYISLQKGLQCSDDIHSIYYNQFVVQKDYPGAVPVTGFAQAIEKEIVDSEDMYAAANPGDKKYGKWRPYQLGIVVEQNVSGPRADKDFTLGQLRHDNYTLNNMSKADWAKPETVEKLKSTDPAPYGSCIFLHVVNPNGEGTTGCTAMALDELKELVKWRDSKKKPLLIQLPIDQWHDISKRCGDLPTT